MKVVLFLAIELDDYPKELATKDFKFWEDSIRRSLLVLDDNFKILKIERRRS